MMEKLRSLELHFADLEARLGAAETYADPALVARLNKEQRELEPVVSAYRAYTRRRQDMSDAQALMGDPDMKELAQEEFQQAKADLEAYRKSQEDTFSWYLAQHLPKVQAAQVAVSGDWVLFVIGENAGAAVELFQTSAAGLE